MASCTTFHIALKDVESNTVNILHRLIYPYVLWFSCHNFPMEIGKLQTKQCACRCFCLDNFSLTDTHDVILHNLYSEYSRSGGRNWWRGDFCFHTEWHCQNRFQEQNKITIKWSVQLSSEASRRECDIVLILLLCKQVNLYFSLISWMNISSKFQKKKAADFFYVLCLVHIIRSYRIVALNI